MEIVNWTNDAYHADRTAVSKSWLDHINRSPAHLRWYLDHPEERKKTKALNIGSLAHNLILENDISRYVVTDTFNCGSKAGKQAYLDYLFELDSEGAASLLYAAGDKPKREDLDNFLASTLERQGKISCTKDQLAQVIAIRDAVHAHEAASLLLSSGQPEVTSLYVDADTGLPCKARADWYRPDLGWIVDLKSTEDASRNAFERSIANYRYHVQAAHYLPAFDAEKFFFIAIEKSPPYGVSVYDAQELHEHGRLHRDRDLLRYQRCLEQNEWPGYPQDIQSIKLKEWAKFI